MDKLNQMEIESEKRNGFDKFPNRNLNQPFPF